MNNAELNNYIKHYIEHDKTHRAIMLTASWGTGKSFYIQNELIPFLSKEENGNHKCIIISLYGINSLSEISKTIYIESKWDTIIEHTPKIIANKVERVKESKSEIKSTIQTGVKTIFKGITSFFGVDLSADEDSLSKIYESIDLSDSLIIFEDLERSGLDVLDVLGYVNNLVEQDNVKILLVANENEIITSHSETDKDGNKQNILDMKSVQYLKTKEKVICDTIYYQCDFDRAIKTIIKLFNNNTLSKFESEEYVEDILDIMASKKCYNLRTFLFACQKTADIFNAIQKEDFSFNKTIFYSVIAFSMMIKNGDIPNWKGSDLVSADFGISKYPLYRFCYNYIRWQEFKIDEVDVTLEAHKKMTLFDKRGSNNDPDLNVLYYYFEHTENEVRDALNRIENRLNNPESIPFYDYRKLAFYFTACHTVLGYDFSSCKDKMIMNITGKNLDIDEELLFLPISDFNNEQEKNLYHDFINQLRNALNSNRSISDFFSYNPSDLKELYSRLINEKTLYTRNHTFISKFDVDKLVDMLFRCTPAQLQNFRSIMFLIYRHATSHDFLYDDIDAMISLNNIIKNKLNNLDGDLDKIVRHQFCLIKENINEFINNLSK